MLIRRLGLLFLSVDEFVFCRKYVCFFIFWNTVPAENLSLGLLTKPVKETQTFMLFFSAAKHQKEKTHTFFPLLSLPKFVSCRSWEHGIFPIGLQYWKNNCIFPTFTLSKASYRFKTSCKRVFVKNWVPQIAEEYISALSQPWNALPCPCGEIVILRTEKLSY